MAQIIICAGISLIPYIRPVGAFQIANVLRRAGYTVQVIDQFPWIVHLGVDQILKLFDKFVGPETLWIGFSTNWFRRINRTHSGNTGRVELVEKTHEDFVNNTRVFTLEEVDIVKNFVYSKNPNVKFVAGGARSFIGRTGDLKPLIDVYVEGYGDIEALKLTKWLEDPSYSDISFSQNEDGSLGLRSEPKAEGFDFQNFKFTWAPEDLVNSGEALPMEIARGCIFNCAFCSYPLNGRKKLDYLKDPMILKEQFEENYERFGTQHYFFLDDTFNDSPQKLEILYEQVFSKLKFKIGFSAFMRLDLFHAHPHTIDLMKEMGVDGAQFGIESLNYDANKTIGKGISRDRIRDTLVKIKNSWGDAIVDSQFIIGLPNEDEASIRSWIEELMEPDYPLDFVKIDALFLNRSSKETKTWQSQFELNPEKFGYTFPTSNPMAWVNNRGFSQADAFRLKREYEGNNKEGLVKKKDKMAWVIYHGHKNIGVSTRALDLKKQGKVDTITSLDYQTRLEFVKTYIQRLLEL